MLIKNENTDAAVLDATTQDNNNQEKTELDEKTNELLSIGLQEKEEVLDNKEGTEQETETEDDEELEVIDAVNQIKIPKRFPHESESAYNVRVQIALTTEAKRRATTDDERSVASERLKELRKGLGDINKKETPAQQKITNNPEEDTTFFSSKEEEQSVKDALEKLGYVSKDSVEQMVKQMLESQTSQQTLAQQERSIEDFFVSRQDIASDKFKQEALIDFVFERFNITEKSTGQEITWAFETAASQLFPKRTAQKAPQDKADLVNIKGGTKASQNKTGRYSDDEVARYQNMGL